MHSLPGYGTPFGFKLPSQLEMAALDAAAIASGVSAQELMERAGRAVFDSLAQSVGEAVAGFWLLLCGPGNNGGDGVVIARCLAERGTAHQIVLCAASKYSPELVQQLGEYSRMPGCRDVLVFGAAAGSFELPGVAEASPLAGADLSELIGRSAVIVDCLLGTGQRSAPRGPIRQLLEICAASADGGREWCSVDLPTGSNGDTGAVYEPCFPSRRTVCIQLVKRGLVQYPARSVCGEISLVPIGIDCSSSVEWQLLERRTLSRTPKREPWAHKGSCGRVLVVGGSRSMPGAPLLSAAAALRSGAGLVTKAQLIGCGGSGLLPEIMLELFEHDGRGFYGADNFEQYAAAASAADVLVLGPGLGTAEETGRFVARCLRERPAALPVVVDADALNLAAGLDGRLDLSNCVLTPHPGEMGRLLQLSTAEVQADRYAAATDLAVRTRATVVLKGAGTLVYCCSSSEEGGGAAGSGFVSCGGNPFMATAGSGDVLAGMIGALLVQGLSVFEAAKTGVYLHGAAGDLASSRSGGRIIAGDMIELIPRAFAELEADETP